MFRKRYTPEFNTIIPTNFKNQLEQESIPQKLTEYWRLSRREVYLYFSGQKSRELNIIPKNTKKILWLLPSIKNIGDAIMALSARSLLKHKYNIDILVDKNVAELFIDDDIINTVYNDPKQIKSHYDLIILDSVKNISLNIKKQYFENIPFCHFRGHFDGIEFNWILFSYHRINAILGNIYSQQQLDDMAQPYLTKSINQSPNNSLLIAIGGEDKLRRVYLNWNSLINKLLYLQLNFNIILIGSHNGLEMANKLVDQFTNKVTNMVGKLSLQDTSKLISQAKFFVGCDGGLMHIASAYQLHGVALFGYFEPQYRLPYRSNLEALFDQYTVNNIDDSLILDTIINKLKAMKAYHD
ncbi:MAG: hypothetical protein RLZZ293_1536 [Pseudomonadota bacterium]|jgi:heptosyltransferase-2